MNFQSTPGPGTLGRNATRTTITTTRPPLTKTIIGETTLPTTTDGVTPRTRGTTETTANRRPDTPTTATRGRQRRTVAPIAVATPTAAGAEAEPGARFTTRENTWSSVDFRSGRGARRRRAPTTGATRRRRRGRGRSPRRRSARTRTKSKVRTACACVIF